jgi:hypothetical protein
MIRSASIRFRGLIFGICLISTAMTAHAAPSLTLTDVPKATGPQISLFNGRDLEAWDGWLGLADPAGTYLGNSDKPIGAGGKGEAFKVVTEDGEPALYIKGQTWGSLVHKGDYSNYHLRLAFKWGPTRYVPRLDQPHNNGLLYHSHGAPGVVWKTWMRAVEFEIMTGSTGMVVPVGEGIEAVADGVHDDSLIAPKLRFVPGAPALKTTGNTALWNIEANSNAEKPTGQWNVLDLYVVGNQAIHVVNGVPVMVVRDLCEPQSKGGPCLPLTHGRIQLQSEGAETFFRHITLEPIKTLPKVVAP